MKIGFILSYPRIVRSDGVVSQAYTWKRGLEERGNEVTLINMWEINVWEHFDVIVLLGFNEYMKDVIKWLYPINKHIVVAPILDPNYGLTSLKCYTHWGCERLRLENPYYALRSCKEKIGLFLVRSEYEKYFVSKGFGISSDKCKVVPLSYGITPQEHNEKREPFCLHISLLCDARKNVKRLIEASAKYQFQLVLCGVLRSEKERVLLNSWMENKPNVKYMGYVSNETMLDLYSRAKVFALPSIYEGVGIVALDAAAMGCNVVVTNLGGPKEYYHGMATEVNPYDVDEIGQAVKTYLTEEKNSQPQLQEMVKERYSLSVISKLLENTLRVYANTCQ